MLPGCFGTFGKRNPQKCRKCRVAQYCYNYSLTGDYQWLHKAMVVVLKARTKRG